MRILNLLALLAIVALSISACSSRAESQDDRPKAQQGAAVETFAIPDWAINIPSEPGQAFYGVGVGSFRNPALMQNGFQQADMAARRQIADTMQVTIQAATKRYMRQVVTPEGDVAEEALAQDVSRSVTDIAISGAQIVKRDTAYDERSDTHIVYSLAKISFDSVAQNMHNELANRVEQVRANADEAFAELDKLLVEDQKEHEPRQPEYEGDIPEVAKPQPKSAPAE